MTLFVFAALLIIAIIVQMLLQNSVVPDYIGLKNGTFQKLPAHYLGFSSMAINKASRVDPLPYIKDFQTSKDIIMNVMNQYGIKEILKDEEKYIHITFQTTGIKTTEDVELIFDDVLRRIEYRSCKRVPYLHSKSGRRRYKEIKDRYFDAI